MQMVEFKLSMNKLHAFSTIGSPCRDKHCGEINTHSNLSAYSDCLRSSTVPGADTNGQYMSQVHAVMLTSERTKLSHQVIHSLHRAVVLCIHPPPIYIAFPLHAAFHHLPEWTTPESANSFYRVLKRGEGQEGK